MDNIKYLNVGCGNEFHRDWTNIDVVAADPAVRAANLIESISCETGTFDVVYHSQVLPHIPKVGTDLMHRTRHPQAGRSAGRWTRLGRETPAKVVGWVRQKLLPRWGSTSLKVGNFRLGGKVHLWMYDRYSLARVLGQAGFEDVRRVDANTSVVAAWSKYELDVRGGAVVDPTSLFMEARRPVL